MQIHNTNQTLVCENYLLTNYLPAMLKEFRSGWVIEFYVEHPETCRLVRKRIKLQRLICRYRTLREARKHINGIVTALNLKLAAGWNPFMEDNICRTTTVVDAEQQITTTNCSISAPIVTQTETSEQMVQQQKTEASEKKCEGRGDISLVNVAEIFLKDTEKNKRYDTFRTYRSFVNVFVPWMNERENNIAVSQIRRFHIIDFLEYVSNERKGRSEKMSARSYNNYISVGSAFFSWLVERCYCEDNPFRNMRKKKKEEKKRTLITPEVREKIENHLRVENPRYLLCLKLMYGGLLRPKEIRHLLVSDLSMSQANIRVRKEVAKNGHERIVPLTEDVMLDFAELGITGANPSDYIFGKDFRTCSVRMRDNVMEKTWNNLRTKLGIPAEMQQYSFRDTGMTDMIKNGMDVLSVKQLADHHSLEMTTIYTNHADPNLPKILEAHAPQFTKKS